MLYFLKKSSLFWFCKFLCLEDPSICFCLNKDKPWLELFFKFNQYSTRPLLLLYTSTICTPLILVPASLKMAGISAITIWEWRTLGNSSYKVKRIRLETIYFSFRLDIGIHNNNHVNEFVSVTKLKKGRINLRRNLWKIKLAKDTKSQSTRKRFTIVQRYSSKIAI